MAAKPDASVNHPTPEYMTFCKCYPIIIHYFKEQPEAICDALFASNLIRPTVRDQTRNKYISNEEKARKMADTLIDRIEQDPNVFLEVMQIIEKDGPWAKDFAKKITECYEQQKDLKLQLHTAKFQPTEIPGKDKAGGSETPCPRGLKLKSGKDGPNKTYRPVDAAVHRNKAYFRRFRTRIIYVYDSQKADTEPWTTLPECPVRDTSLAILPIEFEEEFTLHTVGGRLVFEDDERTNLVGKLYYLTTRPTADLTGTEYCWKESDLPSMKEKRKQVTAVVHGVHLIAAGGQSSKGPSNTVEVINVTGDRQWLFVASLPRVVFRACGCICGDSVYFLGGCVFDLHGNTINIKFACKASLSNLIHSRQGKGGIFSKVADLFLYCSACTVFNNQIFAIGGSKVDPQANEPKSSGFVYTYSQTENNWKKLYNFQLDKNRCFCFAATLSHPDQIVVFGGYITSPDEDCTKSVEIIQIDASSLSSQERREKAAEKEAQKKEELKQQRKLERVKGIKEKQKEGQSSTPKRGPPGRESLEPLVKKPRGTSQLKCHNSNNGCLWTGQLRELDAHLMSCGYDLLPCTNKCQNNEQIVKVLRKCLPDHLTNKCPKRQYQCPYCEEIGEYWERTTFHLQTCPKFLVDCPNSFCKTRIPRCEILLHGCTCVYKPLLSAKYRSRCDNHELVEIAPLKLVLENFQRYVNRDEEFFSSPFYTTPKGYRMRLEIYPNGNGEHRHENYMSVFACPMKGDHDDSISWPFTGKVTFELLNHLENKNHHRMMARFQPECGARVWDDGAGQGGGIPIFISHAELDYQPDKNCRYLKDDTLVFIISVQVCDDINASAKDFTCQASQFSKKVPFIKPVEVLQISGEGKQYNDYSLGLYIDVPEGAIPEDSSLQLEVGMCLYGPFSFPNELYPIAPILMLCPQNNNIHLKKQVRVTLPHYTKNIKPSDVEVIKADHENLFSGNDCVFNYIIVDSDLSFHNRDGKEYATFSLQQFCFISLRKRSDLKFEDAESSGYCICPLNLISTNISLGMPATFFLCLTYYMDCCLTAIEEQFSEHGYKLNRPLIKDFTVIGIEKSIQAQLLDANEIIAKHGWKVSLYSGNSKGIQIINADLINFWKRDVPKLELEMKNLTYPPSFQIFVLPNGRRETTSTFLNIEITTSSKNFAMNLPIFSREIDTPSLAVGIGHPAHPHLESTRNTSDQLEQKDLAYLAHYFDNVEFYLDAMELSQQEKSDVRSTVQAINQQSGMNRCLGYWYNHNPLAATFTALRTILQNLKKEKIAADIKKYFDTKK